MDDWWTTFPWEPLDAHWKTSLSRQGHPAFCSGIEIIDYGEVLGSLARQDLGQIEELIDLLVSGKWVLLRQALSNSEVQRIKEIALNLQTSTESGFHKMVEGTPNFWRNIDSETGHKYAVHQVKVSHYFFPWDPRSKELYSIVYPRWRVLKLLCGLNPTEYEGFTPKDGKCDRIQVVDYPHGTGYLAAHKDPSHNQRLAMCGTLSQKGVDYKEGGLWAQGKDGSKLCVEDLQQTGDLGIGCAELTHGVDEVAGFSEEAAQGSRWFLGLYTNDSDENVQRRTLTPA